MEDFIAAETLERLDGSRRDRSVCGITFAELGSESCRYPIGEFCYGDEGPWRFCGEQKSENLPYCPHHARIACIRTAK